MAHGDKSRLILDLGCGGGRHYFCNYGKVIVEIKHNDAVIGTSPLDLTAPGLGTLDFPCLLRELSRLGPDLPLMLEHLPNPSDYDLAAVHLRQVAEMEGITI